MPRRLSWILAALLLAALPVAASPERLVQLVDYVGVDYAAAVADGEVISEFEYGEMQEFAALIEEESATLADEAARARLMPLASALRERIAAKAGPGEIAALTRQMTDILLASPLLVATPKAIPAPARVADMYQAMCAGCHGAQGQGDGPAVTADMEPPPTDFTDRERARARSLYGLYNTITLGVEGTAMPAFAQLSEDDRWALAFFVGAMHVTPEERARGEQAFGTLRATQLPDLRDLVTATPGELAARDERLADVHAWLRTAPAKLAEVQPDPFAIAIAGVRESVELYAAGEVEAAQGMAVDAYLEGFELAEAALSATHGALVLEVENAMTALRLAIRDRLPEAEVRAAADRAIELLREARATQTGDSLSPSVAFVSALIIILREGLEAILVLGAMAAFLGKTGRRDALPWLHAGWIAALAVGVLTWVISNYFISISGAAREVTEGITALIAAAVLFYVGFWMHSKLNARRWQEFIQGSVQQALDSKRLASLFFIAFIAVYREVFETVLFFQALWAQVTIPSAETSLLAGAALGALVIVGLAFAIFRFGVRLPLRQFFAVTAVVMIALAVIFAGKGVAALQEAGKLPLDPIALPRIELLGIYPTVQSIAAQLLVLTAAIALILYNFRSARPAA